MPGRTNLGQLAEHRQRCVKRHARVRDTDPVLQPGQPAGPDLLVPFLRRGASWVHGINTNDYNSRAIPTEERSSLYIIRNSCNSTICDFLPNMALMLKIDETIVMSQGDHVLNVP
jgi:hypothetical protein